MKVVYGFVWNFDEKAWDRNNILMIYDRNADPLIWDFFKKKTLLVVCFSDALDVFADIRTF